VRPAVANQRWGMVALKVRKVGNSPARAWVLPKGKRWSVAFETGEGQEVFLLEGPNNTYRLTPFDPVSLRRRWEKAEEIHDALPEHAPWP